MKMFPCRSMAALMVLTVTVLGCASRGGQEKGDTGGTPVLASTARDATTTRGRAAVDTLAKGDALAITARFTPEMAKQIPAAAVVQGLKELLTRAPIGARRGESVRQAGDLCIYTAQYAWTAEQDLSFTIIFDKPGSDKIAGMLMQPTAISGSNTNSSYKLKTELRLPFVPGEKWYVFWGGPTVAQNYHVAVRDQRYAFDFTSQSASGSSHTGDGTKNEQYAAWGKTVVAPASGTVVEAVDAIADNKPGAEHMNIKAPVGNHLVVDFGNKEYGVFAHLQKGSLKVKMGDRVKAGQPLGLCGNSGNSSEAHLHFHVQDRAELFGKAEGLPVTFKNYVSDGKPIAEGTPVQGELLEARAG
jgi:murein DD-endopeptidase MepM/ murein hydrolase activator NlpD